MYIENLEYFYKQFDFEEAENFYKLNSNYIEEKVYKELYSNYIDKYKQKLLDYAGVSQEKFRELTYKNIDENLYDYMELIDDILSNLKLWNFKEADYIYDNNPLFPYDEYLLLKSSYIQDYFTKNLPNIPINREKSIAISDYKQYTLLDARAGSGKTTTLCLRTKLLIDKYNIAPSEILILAFNNSVPKKINQDLSTIYNIPEFNNAMTFHKFAMSLLNDRVTINNVDNILRQAIDIIMSDDNYYKRLYEFYRHPLLLEDTYQQIMSDEEYLIFRKNLRSETLKGERVNSLGEKYIADFLFEHNIPYKYEPRIILTDEERASLSIKSKVYCPDFWIKYNGNEYYWEHWAITSMDEISNNNLINEPEKYISNIKTKRSLWKKRKKVLIETKSIDSIDRELFEKQISKKLTEISGIKPQKLSEEELLRKTKQYYKKTKLEQTFESFIHQIDNRLINIDEMQERSQKLGNHISSFVEIGIAIYKKYVELKQSPDFNDIIKNATNKIKHNFSDCQFRESNYFLSNIKYIMIDEYQDFSKLFYNLIDSIKIMNPSVNIFCVGDNLQSIYSFAGSNNLYFENFATYFSKNASIHSLSMNYRSKFELVQFTNQLAVNNCRKITQADKNKTGGEIYNIKVDETFIGNDSLYYIADDTYDRILGKYLKTCDTIIRKNLDKSFLILSRTKNIYDKDIQELFNCKLLNNKNVKVMTMHASKGLEADIVILINANEGQIPMINSLSAIQQLFGISNKDLLDEEYRLLYVALSRAREKIYILSESIKTSDVILSLNPKETYFYNDKMLHYNRTYKKYSDKADYSEAKAIKYLDMLDL